MTVQEQQQDDSLSALGGELSDLNYAGKLDFDTFKAFVHRAIAIIGPHDERMEFLWKYTRDQVWKDWLIQELQKAPSSRVA